MSKWGFDGVDFDFGVVNMGYMITAKEKVSIPKTEYLRLKEIDKRFNNF